MFTASYKHNMIFCEQGQSADYFMIMDLGWNIINFVWKTFSRLFKAAVPEK